MESVQGQRSENKGVKGGAQRRCGYINAKKTPLGCCNFIKLRKEKKKKIKGEKLKYADVLESAQSLQFVDGFGFCRN